MFSVQEAELFIEAICKSGVSLISSVTRNRCCVQKSKVSVYIFVFNDTIVSSRLVEFHPSHFVFSFFFFFFGKLCPNPLNLKTFDRVMGKQKAKKISCHISRLCLEFADKRILAFTKVVLTVSCVCVNHVLFRRVSCRLCCN